MSVFRFVTSSDLKAAADGLSSSAYVATSDIGTLLFPLSSDRQYELSDIYLSLNTTGDDLKVEPGTLDSDGAAGTFTPIGPTHQVSQGAALGGDQDDHIHYGIGPSFRYGAGANFFSLRITPSDSDAEGSIAYSLIDRPA
jgi:hypothetical protein